MHRPAGIGEMLETSAVAKRPLGKIVRRTIVGWLLLSAVGAANLRGQTLYDAYRPYMERLARTAPSADLATPSAAPDQASFTRSSPADWASLIDSTWGPGPSTAEKLRVFDVVCGQLESKYAAFVNLDLDIKAFRDRYRPEVARGVSRGRFAAIMNHLALSLREAHTMMIDQTVNWGTNPRPGVPLFVVGAWLDNSRFGASLTPLRDGSLLVIKALPKHVLGLEAGDVVLGYDGVPWRDLVMRLLDAQLPLHVAWAWGTTEESMEHCLLMSAGANWHLFDTIDIVKHRTGETLHLPTAPLASQAGRIWGNEQLPVPGVPMPDLASNNLITWGVVEGTRLGYIYVASWSWEAQYATSEKFATAIDSLLNRTGVDGLIVDLRLNLGGSMIEAHEGYSRLFGERLAKVAYDVRNDPGNHLSMKAHPTYTAELFAIPGGPRECTKPIAILTGPGAVSNGDWESLRLRFHPKARSFGKPSNGAFSSSSTVSVGSDWYFSYTYGVGYLVDSHRYLVHTGAPIDEPVWFEPEDVAEGRDTVVEAALAWIEANRSRVPRRRLQTQP